MVAVHKAIRRPHGLKPPTKDSEERIKVLPWDSPQGNALAAAALTVKTSLDAFVRIAKVTE